MVDKIGKDMDYVFFRLDFYTCKFVHKTLSYRLVRVINKAC